MDSSLLFVRFFWVLTLFRLIDRSIVSTASEDDEFSSNGKEGCSDPSEIVALILGRLEELSDDMCNRTVRRVIHYEFSSLNETGQSFRNLTLELCTDEDCIYRIKGDDSPLCKRCDVRLVKTPSATNSSSWGILPGHKCNSDLTGDENGKTIPLDKPTVSSEDADDKKLRKLFSRFVVIHKKTYELPGETERRFENFKRHLKRAEAARRSDKASGKYGVTHLADMSEEELGRLAAATVDGLSSSDFSSDATDDRQTIVVDLPETYDWRQKGAVTSVKYQGMCGDCWAFATMSVLESQYYLKYGTLSSFSEQQLVDCDTIDEGCNGGNPLRAYRALQQTGGIQSSTDYPYTAKRSDECRYDASKSVATVYNFTTVASNETKIARYLYEHGPIAVLVNAGPMLSYLGGISYPSEQSCDPTRVNHAVVLVGYGVENGTGHPYWIIKNSWGDNWGERGYYYLYRGVGACGVNKYPSIGYVA